MLLMCGDPIKWIKFHKSGPTTMVNLCLSEARCIVHSLLKLNSFYSSGSAGAVEDPQEQKMLMLVAFSRATIYFQEWHYWCKPISQGAIEPEYSCISSFHQIE